jgi:adenylate cyclase
MGKGWRNVAISLLVLALGVGIRVLLPSDPPVLRELEARYFDVLQELKPRAYQPLPVRVIDIDDATLEKLGQWPWPRTLMAQLIERLSQAQPAAIALDMVLAEPDRTSPKRALPELSQAPDAVGAWLGALPDHDRVLAETIAAAPVVTGFALSQSGGSGRMPAVKAGWSRAGDDPAQFVPRADSAATDLPELEAAASGNGSLDLVLGKDRIVRRVPLIVGLGDALYPSLAAEALRVAQGASTYIVKASGASGVVSFGKKTGITGVRIGAVTAETDASGAIWLYDTGRIAERTIPAWRVLDGSVPADALRGNIIFIGIGATGLTDLRATPLSASVPGVEVHAQIVEQTLLQNFLRRPDWAPGAELLYMVALGLALALGLPRFGPAASAIFGGAVVAVALGVSWYAFSQTHILIAPIYPSLVALCVYLTASLLNQLETERERRRVRQQFSRYLPKPLVEELAKDPGKLRLGGQLRQMTFLFSDLRGFTSIAERCKAHPEALTDVINRFLARMSAAVHASGGTVDKYIGDCIMAFWNAPLDDAAHAAHALDAALAMRRALLALNEELAAEAQAGSPVEGLSFRLESGIGINTGDCIVGNFGWEEHFEYSVLGDAVNLASRLEGESKNYGVPIVIGEATERLASGYATLELDLVAVKGKRDLTRIFALLGGRDLGSDPRFLAFRAEHQQMLGAYRAREWREARSLIEHCRGFDPELAPLYDVYLARIAAFERLPPTVTTEQQPVGATITAP